MRFTTKFTEKAKSSTLRMKLALELGKSYYTIVRRLDNPDNDEFTKAKYLEPLSRIFDIPESEIFVKE